MARIFYIVATLSLCGCYGGSTITSTCKSPSGLYSVSGVHLSTAKGQCPETFGHSMTLGKGSREEDVWFRRCTVIEQAAENGCSVDLDIKCVYFDQSGRVTVGSSMVGTLSQQGALDGSELEGIVVSRQDNSYSDYCYGVFSLTLERVH